MITEIINSMNANGSSRNIARCKRELAKLGIKARHNDYIGWYAVIDWNWEG